ncbi:sporozoite surface protein 2-like [Mya arenaria]|uniref:sporozoite surface protein 2-like n=1 Tax=Mya arenaria TaxID=6604 RepID=UPI0022E8F665|nr:sporozoite surface protein 2-like [Mya arenaria]
MSLPTTVDEAVEHVDEIIDDDLTDSATSDYDDDDCDGRSKIERYIQSFGSSLLLGNANPNKCEKPNEGKKLNECEKPNEGEKLNEGETLNEVENSNECEKLNEGENCNECEKPNECENSNECEKPNEPETPMECENLMSCNFEIKSKFSSFIKCKRQSDGKPELNVEFTENNQDDASQDETARLLIRREQNKRASPQTPNPAFEDKLDYDENNKDKTASSSPPPSQPKFSKSDTSPKKFPKSPSGLGGSAAKTPPNDLLAKLQYMRSKVATELETESDVNMSDSNQNKDDTKKSQIPQETKQSVKDNSVPSAPPPPPPNIINNQTSSTPVSSKPKPTPRTSKPTTTDISDESEAPENSEIEEQSDAAGTDGADWDGIKETEVPQKM